MDLMIFAKISWFLRKFWVFLYFAFSSPSNHVGTLIRSLSNCTKAQGTLLDLHGPPNGPLNGPSEANFWGPLVKKGPAGSLHGPNWSIFLDRSLDNIQTWIYSLVWDQSEIRFPEQSQRSCPVISAAHPIKFWAPKKARLVLNYSVELQWVRKDALNLKN